MKINPAAGRPIWNNVDGIRQISRGFNLGIHFEREPNPGLQAAVKAEQKRRLCPRCGADLEVWKETFREEHMEHCAMLPQEWEANSNLIAAAPKMYEALKEIAKGEGRYNTDPLNQWY